jgi:tetratricopeptide (TPR) repeat protein
MSFLKLLVVIYASAFVFNVQDCVAKNIYSTENKIAIQKSVDSIKTRLDDLEKKDAERKLLEEKINNSLIEVRKEALSNGQKIVDWWLSGIATFLTIFTVVVSFFIYKSRQEHKQALIEILALRKEAATSSGEIRSLSEKAQKEVDDISKERFRLRNLTDLGVSEAGLALASQTREDALVVGKSKEVPLGERLYAQGITALGEGNWVRAESLFRAAAQFAPDDSAIQHAWGVAFGRLADSAKGEEEKHFRLEAISKYKAAVAFKPDSHEAYYNWGNALGLLADAVAGEEQKRLRLESISRYQAAISIKPDNFEALYNWGGTLSRLANVSKGEEQKRLRLDAISRYEAAVKIKSDDHDALYSWANNLSRLADLEKGGERNRLLLRAISRYEAAITVKPDSHKALNNYADTLVNFANGTEGSERERLITEASRKFDQVASIVGHATYNQACIAAIRNLPAEFVRIANSLPKEELPSKDHIDNDEDLEVIRETPEFKEWYKQTF